MTPEVQTVGGGSREGERSRNMLEDSQINDDMQLGFGTDISGKRNSYDVPAPLKANLWVASLSKDLMI